MSLEDKLREVIIYSKGYKGIDDKIEGVIRQLNGHLMELKTAIREEAVKSIGVNQIAYAKELLSKVEVCEELEKEIVDLMDDKRDNNSSLIKKYDLDYNFQGKSVLAFEIKGEEVNVDNWKDLLVKSCNYFLESYDKKFLDIVKKEKIKGSTRKYLAFSGEEMRYPITLYQYDIVVETHHSVREIIKIIKDIMAILKIDLKTYKILLKE